MSSQTPRPPLIPSHHHHHHHHHQAQQQHKPLSDLEVTVVSAKHLKNVNWRNGDLKPYAVAYLDPDSRSATKPDDSGSTSPVWNERLTLPLSQTLTLTNLQLTLDVFHSKPSETPKPLVGTVRVSLSDLIDLRGAAVEEGDVAISNLPTIKTLELRRPSGRPQGKIRIKIALRERPHPPPALTPEQKNYQMQMQMPPPPPPASSAAYYYSTAPPPMPSNTMPHPRDYHRNTYSPPPPPHPVNVTLPPHYSNPIPHRPHYPPYSGSSGGYSDPYSGYYSSVNAAYYSAPPAPMPPARPVYYDHPPNNYNGPSAPLDYASSYENKPKGSRMMGMGTGLAVGAVAGALGGLALEEGIKYEEDKIADRVETDLAARDDYSDYHADY